jgi:hypothetical protein
MTVTVLTRDLAALPTALLPLVKQQCRVDHSGDDTFITSVIARTIAKFEDVKEVTVNPTAATWTAKVADFKNGMATLPVRPAALTAPLAGYAIVLKFDSIHGIPIQALQGAAADLTVALTCGYADVATMSLSVQDWVLRIAAHLYEHREILIPGSEFVAPDFEKDATWWMPRA